MINKFESTHGITECDIVFSTGKTLKIRVCPIPSDGDCLFGAIVHQHLFLEVGSDKYVQRVAELRKEVVLHLKDNLKLYERELLGHIYEKKSKITNFKEECHRFIEDYLSKEHHWAGAESIAAISFLFKTNIIIFDECGDVRFANSYNPSYNNIITLVYRVSKAIQKENISNIVRNHYDSIVKLTDDVVNECAATLTANYTNTCAMKTNSDTIFIE